MAKIQDNTDKVLAEADRLIRQKLELAALMVEKTAKQPGHCPVKTGTLRRSITHAITLDFRTAIVGSNVEYAAYVEMGTPKRPNYPAQPYLRPALMANRNRIRRLFNS